MGSPAITVHHLENSRSTRVVWLLEELDLPYHLKLYKRDPVTMLAPPELRRVHPLGKSPVVVIDDTGSSITLAESSVIMEYIMEHYAGGRLSPPRSDRRKRAEHDFWMHYSEASVMPPILGRMWAALAIRDPKNPTVNKLMMPKLQEHFDFCNEALAKQPFFGGEEFGAADIAMIFPLLQWRSPKFKHINQWIEKVESRPAYKRAIEKSGPVDVCEGDYAPQCFSLRTAWSFQVSVKEQRVETLTSATPGMRDWVLFCGHDVRDMHANPSLSSEETLPFEYRSSPPLTSIPVA